MLTVDGRRWKHIFVFSTVSTYHWHVCLCSVRNCVLFVSRYSKDIHFVQFFYNFYGAFSWVINFLNTTLCNNDEVFWTSYSRWTNFCTHSSRNCLKIWLIKLLQICGRSPGNSTHCSCVNYFFDVLLGRFKNAELRVW